MQSSQSRLRFLGHEITELMSEAADTNFRLNGFGQNMTLIEW